MRSRPVMLATALLAVAAASVEAAPPPSVQAEVRHLLAYLEGSGCRFQRNGKWHAAREASAHLKRKYDYLVRRDLVKRTEDFIDLAATRSSVSGRPYQVRCGPDQTSAGGAWLSEELTRYRAARGSR